MKEYINLKKMKFSKEQLIIFKKMKKQIELIEEKGLILYQAELISLIKELIQGEADYKYCKQKMEMLFK